LKLKVNLRKKLRKEVLSYSWPLIFLGLITGLLPSVDSFVIGYLRGASDVGIYSAAILLSGFMLFIPSLFIRLFFPLIMREFSENNLDIIKELSKQVQKWILIVNLPLFVLMIIFPGAFINLLFGAQYIAAETPLRFLTIAFFLSSLSMIFSSLISMIGKSKLILLDMAIFSFSNLILNLIFVPKYGISGAAFATMISYVILATIFFFQVKHYTSITLLRRKMISVLLSIIPPTLLLLYIKRFIPISITTIILEGSFFVLLYILFIFITKGLDRNDFMILKSIKKNLLIHKFKQ
jgi:O-antigen/teichoic acid export membrane protein